MFVPVVDSAGKPLMPTIPSRARRWVMTRKATPFWNRGVFGVRLNVEPSARELQPVAVGIDPGSKREGLTVKSETHTFLNVHATAVTWVKDAMAVRRNMRRARRFRTTPCRKPRFNRTRGGLPPSTRARWQWKLRLARWLCRLYPISVFVIENIKAKTTGQRRWDASFSPLEVGKQWFYDTLRTLGRVETKTGYETKELRDTAGLKKAKDKLAEVFEAHCVDAWVLANWETGGHTKPDNRKILCITPLRFHRRQLHRLQPEAGGARKHYGGTQSLGFKRGALVKHPKHGVVYVGGTMNGRISLHSLMDGNRLCRDAAPSVLKFLAYSSWRAAMPPSAKADGPLAA